MKRFCMLSLMTVFMGAIVMGAGNTKRSKVKASLPDAKQEVIDTMTSEVKASLCRHNFLYAGQSKQRRMFIIKDGEVKEKHHQPCCKCMCSLQNI